MSAPSPFDLRCLAVQEQVYRSHYPGRVPNAFDPWRAPGRAVLPSGEVCRNDLCYGTTWPNSFFDLWHPDDRPVARPVVVYFHGGGFLFGDKSAGDPLAIAQHSSYLLRLVQAGYALVNANYALAPEHRFPTQVQQVDQLMRYLTDHADALHLDMQRVALAGSSAGADLTTLYGTCVCNPAYAAQLGVDPVMTPETLRVLAIDEAALDSRIFNDAMYAMLLCWLGETDTTYAGRHLLLNAKEHIADRFLPSWINTSNQEPYFLAEGRDLAAKLAALGVPHDLVDFPPDREALNHGYLGTGTPCAEEAVARLLAFLDTHLTSDHKGADDR